MYPVIARSLIFVIFFQFLVFFCNGYPHRQSGLLQGFHVSRHAAGAEPFSTRLRRNVPAKIQERTKRQGCSVECKHLIFFSFYKHDLLCDAIISFIALFLLPILGFSLLLLGIIFLSLSLLISIRISITYIQIGK